MDESTFSLTYDKHTVKFDPKETGELDETFFNDTYLFLKVQGKDVIDIGASVGDTAIYFAIRGARRVISLEPYPYTFNYAVKNVGSSEFKDRIEVVNVGYGEDRKIRIDTSFIPTIGSGLREAENGLEIDLYSLETLLKKYGMKSAILKLDCEGCEYNLLKESCETLSKFPMIQIEYHYGYEELVKKLEDCGFNVRYTEPKRKIGSFTGKLMMQGYIYAERYPQED
ncbi:MAG: FkbM family methyltransferase [Candidatus Parvarchaeota archaeon]